MTENYSVRLTGKEPITFGTDRRRAIQAAQRLCRATKAPVDVANRERVFRSYVWDWTRKRVLRV